MFFFGLAFSINAQTEIGLEEGTATFLSSKNVYVKFTSTEQIKLGDTLFVKNGISLEPALVVSNKSSSSTVCTPLGSQKFKKGDTFFAEVILAKKEKVKAAPEEKTDTANLLHKPVIDEINADEPIAPLPDLTAEETKFKQKIRGRLSASSYTNVSDRDTLHRMRYAFSYRGDNLKNTRWSTDNYINFRHTIGEWQEVQDNFAQALKIYSLSVKYQIDSLSNIVVGRRINPKTSSMGAIDGIQYEKGVGKIVFGALAGSRPDFRDYGFNINLFQAGAYASLASTLPGKYRMTTLGFVEQRNQGNVDRRFVYFQHSGDLLPKLNMFGSVQVDLYENIRGAKKTTASLTNFYVTMRYRFSKKFRVNGSYDNRKNIIFYESYKSFIDRYIEQETRQGLRFGTSYRISKRINWGATSSLRFQKSGANASRNLNTYLSLTQVPGLKMRATFRVNFLQNNYLNSRVFSARLSKGFFKKKLNADLNYRHVDFQYSNLENHIIQHIGGVDFSFNLLKKLTMYLYYEGTLDNEKNVFHRINTKLIKRF